MTIQKTFFSWDWLVFPSDLQPISLKAFPYYRTCDLDGETIDVIDVKDIRSTYCFRWTSGSIFNDVFSDLTSQHPIDVKFKKHHRKKTRAVKSARIKKHIMLPKNVEQTKDLSQRQNWQDHKLRDEECWQSSIHKVMNIMWMLSQINKTIPLICTIF